MLCFVMYSIFILLLLPNGDKANGWCILTVGILIGITRA